MLAGDKVVLGPVLQDDGAVFFRWRNTPQLMQLDGQYRPCSQSEFEAWFCSIGKTSERVVFSIRTREHSLLLGYLEIREIQPLNRSAALAILMGEPGQWGRGYGREALQLGSAFCWRELNLQRLSLVVLAQNERARRAYHAAGFREEGCLRQAVYTDGRFADLVVMARLRSDEVQVPAASSAHFRTHMAPAT